MLEPFTSHFKDLSSTDGFRFQFQCAICGQSWTSSFRAVEPVGVDQPMPLDLRALIWESGHRASFDQANTEALFHFNHCERCGRWVCDDCYRPSPFSGVGDACRQCAPLSTSEIELRREPSERTGDNS